MTNKQMICGQLYRVGITCRNAHEICTMELLLVADNNEDAKQRLPWIYDFGGWAGYRVDWTVKEPTRCVVLKTKFERTPENEPDQNVKRESGTQALFQRIPVAGGKKYEVKAQTVLYAKSPDKARQKLAERISGGSEFVKFQIEELADASGYAVARDVSVFPRASFVRG